MTLASSVRDHRARYFERNGFSTAAYEARVFPVRVGPLRIPFPNPGLLPFHDLHHVVTGYDTDLAGEAEISAFELRTGWRSPLVLLLCLGSLAIGLVLVPRRVLRAWRRARGARGLYRSKTPVSELLDMNLADLRAELGVPAAGLADARSLPPAAER